MLRYWSAFYIFFCLFSDLSPVFTEPEGIMGESKHLMEWERYVWVR